MRLIHYGAQETPALTLKIQKAMHIRLATPIGQCFKDKLLLHDMMNSACKY